MTVLSTVKPQPNTEVDATALSSNFTAIEAVVNGALDEGNFTTGLLYSPSKLKQGGANTNDILQWNGSAWVPVAQFTMPAPATTLPGSPVHKQLAVLTDSTTAPTYEWLLQYSTDVSDSNKWVCLGGTPQYARNDGTVSSAGQTSWTYDGATTITVPRAGLYRISGWALNTASSGAAFYGPRAGSSGSVYAGGTLLATGREVLFTLSASDTVDWGFWVSGGHSGSWTHREVRAMPIRVA